MKSATLLVLLSWQTAPMHNCACGVLNEYTITNVPEVFVFASLPLVFYMLTFLGVIQLAKAHVWQHQGKIYISIITKCSFMNHVLNFRAVISNYVVKIFLTSFNSLRILALYVTLSLSSALNLPIF